ncbi:carbohydrate ABC transporter permease [Phyllobacterium zundukense]|uniref:Sugar ABC transporter permease n=1 Tax=Phyllobacterium zundukense TaxID=1867719 RepID=A0ACD4CW20_9HYPH|nr:sugar ABC transporter permease [Phyllobacterium zundukense]UXN57663.1 sugar ABC transporter permease [Phyllobacterium zundukense]
MSDLGLDLDNYVLLFSDSTFIKALGNTLYFTAVEVVCVAIIALGIAVLLQHPLGRNGIFRILLIVPWAIAPVANAVLWKWILNSNYGILNSLLTGMGLIQHNQVWLGTPRSALNFLLLVDIWKSVPFIALLLLAGLQRVPQTLYRAAYMDGASRMQMFLAVTLPSMKSAIAIAVILQTIWALRVFDIVFVLTRGGPADGTVSMNFLAYRTTFNFLQFGSGAAIANLIFVTTFALAIVYIVVISPKSTGAGR